MEPSSKWYDLSVLQEALKAFLDATDDNALESIRLSVDEITNRGSIETTKTDLTADAAAAFFKCIVQAYAVRIFKTKTAACGPLAQILSWFVTKLSPNQRRAVFEILFYQKEYDASMLSVTVVSKKRVSKPNIEKKTDIPSAKALLELLSIQNLTDQETEAVLNLLLCAIKGDSDSDDSTMSSKLWTDESGIEDEILASKELLSLFLNRSSISDVSQGGTSTQTAEEIQADEQIDAHHLDSGPSEALDGEHGHESLSGALLLTVMNTCSSEDAFSAFLSNLDTLYRRSVILKKLQFHRILEKMLSLEAVDASAVLLRGVKTERVNNVTLISDIAEYLFATPILYLTSPVVSFDNICELISLCAERIFSETPLHVPDVFSVFVKYSEAKDGNNQWICERIHLVSLFLSDEMHSAPVSSISEVFVESLLNVFLTLEDQIRWEDMDDLVFDVFSDLRTVNEYCHKNASFPVFSRLLKVSQLNSDVFTQLSNNFCTDGILHRWSNQPDAEDVIALLELCKVPQSESVEWLLMALESLLKSEVGRNAICSSQRSDADWMEVCVALLNTSSSAEMSVAVTAVPVLVHLACTLDKEKCRHPINALMSETEQFLRAEIQADDFAAFLTVLIDSSSSILNEVIAAACSAAAGMERIEDVQFFSHLYTCLTDPARQEKESLKAALFSALGELFGLMHDIDGKGRIDSLIELICLFLEDGNAPVNKEKARPFDDHDSAIPPFSSARFPSGQGIQSETASLTDLRRMIETFNRPNLSLESRDLRNTVLRTHTPPCKKEEEGEAKFEESSMILTATTEENIAMVQEVVADGNPVLLIGSTGVGKTATLTEVCRRKGVGFVRINMSSNLTPEDFLAKVIVGSGGEIVQELQPFAKSFENGVWVLLDEMSLAEESALKVVIDAMESGEIVICDKSSALSSTIVVKKHPDFRLFASQNPWQTGKRDRLSDAFLSRFSIMHFKELPRDEWREIVEKKIGEGGDKDPEIIRKLAKQMTDFHCDVRAKIAEGCSEKGSHATITNRELLIWTDMVLAEEQLVSAEKKLGDHAWLIYGCRFRGDGRQLIQKVIGDHNLTISSAGSTLEDAIERFSRIQAPCLKKNTTLMDQFWTTHFSSKPFPDEDMRNAFDACSSVHRAVLKKIQSSDFMKTFGVYTTFSESWLAKWIADALEDHLLGTDDWTGLGRLGAETYCSRIRHDQARRDLFGIFARQFHLDLGNVPTMASSVSEMPVVLNDQMCQHLVCVAEAIRSEQPVLIEGTAGSGKSCLGKVIAFLLGNLYEQVTITQESEPSAMLGQCLPSSSPGGERIVQWRDGPLTRAFVEGSVCIVDNIGQAELVLQEMMNPVLESPKVLCLTERGDTEPLRCRVLADGTRSSTPGPARGFQFIATFTPKGVAARGMDILSKELTASLFTRFVAIHIDDPAGMPDDDFRGALQAVIRCCLPRERCCEASLRAISDYCLRIRQFVSENAQMFLSFRDFATLIDIATVLMIQRPDVEDQVALHCAMTVTFAAQMRDGDAKRSLCSEMGCPSNALGQLKLLDGFEKSSDLVLTESRRRHAQAVLLGALVNKPVLLEGKPAVGKTSLVLGLIGFGGPDKKVRILSNCDTTTIQDYFGTWIPSDNGFSFHKGILVQAMESGDWFISDKFNLAPVAVIAALMPFLEGNCTVQIPGSHMRVSVHQGFRFFATQNPSRGGNDSRKQLPITVRNRFLAVDVEDFPRDEMPEIVRDKFRGGRYEGTGDMDSQALAKLYFTSADGLHLTMRDIVKIVRRYKLLRDEGQQNVTWAAATMSLLGPRATTREETVRLMHLIESSFGSGGVAEAEACASKYIKQERQGVSFFQGHLRIHFPGFKLDNSPLWRDSLSGIGPPTIFQHKLVDLAFAMKANEPVLLYGESAFKTELIKTWLELSGMTERVQRVHLTSQSEATDLIGQVQLVSFVDVLENLASIGNFILSNLILHLTAKSKSPSADLHIYRMQNLLKQLLTVIRRLIDVLSGEKSDRQEENKTPRDDTADAEQECHDKTASLLNESTNDSASEDGYDKVYQIDPTEGCDQEENSPNASTDLVNAEKDTSSAFASPSANANGPSNDSHSQAEETEDMSEDDYAAAYACDHTGESESVHGLPNENEDNEETRLVAHDQVPLLASTSVGVPVDDKDYLAVTVDEQTEDDYLSSIDQILLMIPQLTNEILGEEISADMKRMVHRLEQLRMFIRSREAQNSKPCFLFRDGPFVKAITMEHAFVVEDYDLCAQAVTERLNSALEVDPMFSIPEDMFFSDRMAAEMEIPKKGYCFIATSHLDSANKKPQLSAAMRSRLTQIRVPVYETLDIMSIAEEKLRCKLQASEVEWLPYVMDSIRCVRSEAVGDDSGHHYEDFRGILRWITFVTEHPRNLSIQKRCMLGAKFFYLAGYPVDIQNDVLRKTFTETFERLQSDLALPMGKNPFEIEETAGDAGRVVSLMGYGLSLSVPSILETPSSENRLSKLSLCVTASVRENMARIFASICTNSPLLLEGAPGIGKTAVINQVARLFGTDLERINCSSNTSVEHLYGSLMPMYVNNRRVFKWREGKLLKALKSQKWILLDEINLLPTQVLESLVPLLNGSAEADGFSVPGKLDSKPIAVRGTRIFATMNPATEGGGRAKLSRSIKNTFTAVQIEGYDDDDLQQILKKQFEGLIKKELVREEDLRHVFDVYKKVEQWVEKGEIQGASHKRRLNLRDLKSVHDIVAGNIETQISHHRLMACDDDVEESEQDFDKQPVVTNVIRKALQLVLKHRFDNRSAEEQIQRTIDEVFRPPQMELEQSDSQSIDLSVGDLVRIGNVYMEKDEARVSQGSLVHTVKTIRQLELLATASQSQRAVLLEGPTCSKKTSLVKELASLRGVPLLVLSLHQDFEVSDLIGQWLPVSSSDIASELSKNVYRLRDNVAKLGFRIAEKAPQKKRVCFYKAMQASYAKSTSTTTFQEIEQVVENVKLALEMLKGCNLTKWQSLMHATDELKESVMSSEDTSSSIVFKFVESDLIKALKAGSFILFDNINAASPDVIERLLSLFEETPFLSLYEHSEGEDLKLGAGIHPTTRIFATADRKKINTFGLSNPLLNRMIKIWLPEIDGDVIDLDPSLLETHETVEIVSEALGSVEGANVAAILAVAFHARVKQLVQTFQITITHDCKISFRMLQQAISVTRTWLDKGEPLFSAVVWGLWRVYAAVVETDKDRKKLQQAIHEACKDTALLPLHKFYFVSNGRDILTPFQKESRDLQSMFALLLHACMKHLLKHIQNARLDAENSKTLSVSLWNYFTRLHGHGTENAFNIAEGANTVPELIQFCRDRGGPLSEYFKDISEGEEKIMKDYRQNPDTMISQTKEFISNSTFTDWRLRKAFLKDMCSVLDALFPILDVRFRDRNHEFECIRELFQKISQIKHLLCCFFPLEKEAFGKEVRVLETYSYRCTDRVVKCNLQKRLSEVICKADTKLSCSIGRLMRSTDASRPKRNRTGIAFALSALDWKTTLLFPEGLLVSAREDFCAFEILDIRKNLSRLRIMKEVGELLAKLPLQYRGRLSKLGSMSKVTACRMAHVRLQSFTAGSSNTSGLLFPNTLEANEEDGDAELVHSAVEQLDLVLRSSDSSFALSDELNAAVKFHVDIMSDLLEDKKRNKNAALTGGDIKKCGVLCDRLIRTSHSIAKSEFCLPWIALFNPLVKIDVPYKIVRCSQEALRSEIFERGVPASAVLLVGDLDSRTSLSDLVSLVLFEKQASDAAVKKTHVNVLHYTWSEECSSRRKWIEQWTKTYKDTYTFSLSNKKLLSVDALPKQSLSRLGITIITCLSTLAIYGKDCTVAKKRASIVEQQFIPGLEKNLNSYLGEVDLCLDKEDGSLFLSMLQVDACFVQSQKNRLSETGQELSECLRLFSEVKLLAEESKLKEALDGLKEKLLSSGWQSTSIAFSFRNLMAKLANYPVHELTICLNGLLQQVNSKFGDYFLAVDMITPILKLKKLLIQYAQQCLNYDEADVWKKCNNICFFVSETVAYFIDLLIGKDDDMKLDRSRSFADVDRQQEVLNKLIDDIKIPMQILQENDLDNIFSKIKDEFEKKLKKVEREGDPAEIYKEAPMTRGDVDKRELQDPVSVVPVHRDRWTYSLLLESKPFVLFLVEVMRQWEAHFEKLYRSTAEKHKTEWCILVNNSGSMITKEIQLMEALVLVMEALKRQEQPFAVARFGNRRSQQMLKLMDEPFTPLIGQKILESFSFDEGTCPASAVRYVAEKVWPTGIYGNETLQYHRVMLLIMDGLTQERSPEDYTSTCKEKDFELVVLNLKDEAQKETMRQIERLWSKVASCHEVLDVRSVDMLPQLLAGLMIQYMENTLSKIERNRRQLRSIKRPVVSDCRLKSLTFGVDESVLLEDLKKQVLPKLPGNFSKKSFFDCGCATDEIPYATEMRRLLSTDQELDVGALDYLERELLDLYQSLQVQPGNKEQLKIAEAVWMKAEAGLCVEIARMAEALERFLPQNRFTRKRADIQGPSIHLPRFMKHIATRGNEKIFMNEKGGGKSEYAVAVLLDISASMAQGMKRSCALQTVVMLISALKQMNIEDFSVILFGEGIYPIKLSDDAWEAYSIALLFSAVLHRNEFSTMDADALLFAAQLLDQSSVRGPKKIFVVTDGYGNSGVRLASVLHKIEEDLGVDVLAMGVGPEEFFVKKCYPKWITAALPQMVPDALESMFENMESTARAQKTNQKDTINWQKIISFKGRAAGTVKETKKPRLCRFRTSGANADGQRSSAYKKKQAVCCDRRYMLCIGLHRIHGLLDGGCKGTNPGENVELLCYL